MISSSTLIPAVATEEEEEEHIQYFTCSPNRRGLYAQATRPNR